MLRTIASRSDLIKGTLRKTAIRTITRTLAVESVKRIPFDRKKVIVRHHLPQQWTYQIIRCYSNLPNYTKVTLPALSPTMEEGKIVSWAKKEGDALHEGDLLAEIETDKATMAFETPEEGFLAKILIPAGTKGIPVGKLVCIIVEKEADCAAFKNFVDSVAGAPPSIQKAPTPEPAAPVSDAPILPKTPEHTKVALPALSPTMEEGKIISWAKKEGDKLNEGDVLAEIETDKATMAFETPEEGYLAKIILPSGPSPIKVGKMVCIIVENQADVEAFKNYVEGAETATIPIPVAAAPSGGAPVSAPQAAAAPSSHTGTDRVYASPMARRLAEQRQLRLQGKGTGLFGAITVKDVEAGIGVAPAGAAPPVPQFTPPPPPVSAPTAAPPKPAAPRGPPSKPMPPGAAYSDVPITNIRGVIAKRLLQSKTTIPHYYLTTEVNVDKLLALRSQFNKKLEKDGVKLSVNDFVIKATALASKKVPEANSVWMNDFIRVYKNVDVSVAVSTPTGLITPIIFEANNKGVIEISKEVKELANRARQNKLQPHEFQGGTISVSNLGMFGITNFSAIINPGQSCILAVGTTLSRLVEDPNSEKGFSTANFIQVQLSSDHRVVDGAEGAKWLQAFHHYLSDPINMIL